MHHQFRVARGTCRFSYPTTNQAMDKQMDGLRRIVQSILNAAPEELCGLRVESRLRQGDTLDEGGGPITANELMHTNLEVLKLWDLLVLNGYVKVMPALQDALRAAWERFEAGGFPSLQARRLAYFKLLALAGHSSEHWNRYILQELAGEAPAEPEAEAPMNDDGPQALEEIGLEHPGPQPQALKRGNNWHYPLPVSSATCKPEMISQRQPNWCLTTYQQR